MTSNPPGIHRQFRPTLWRRFAHPNRTPNCVPRTDIPWNERYKDDIRVPPLNCKVDIR